MKPSMKFLMTAVMIFGTIGIANAYDAKTTLLMKQIEELNVPQYPDGPTMGKCMAAIDIAKETGEWAPSFSKDECADLAGKSYDYGMQLLSHEDGAAEEDSE